MSHQDEISERCHCHLCLGLLQTNKILNRIDCFGKNPTRYVDKWKWVVVRYKRWLSSALRDSLVALCRWWRGTDAHTWSSTVPAPDTSGPPMYWERPGCVSLAAGSLAVYCARYSMESTLLLTQSCKNIKAFVIEGHYTIIGLYG